MSVQENLKSINAKIAAAAHSGGYDTAATQLIAVSKNQPNEKIAAALAAGQRLFGENRVQEAQAHWAALKATGAYPDIALHLIGPLQTNKVKDAVALFDVIQTLDREKLAKALGAEMAKQGRALSYFIQVNTGNEPQKAGIAVKDAAAFAAFCKRECGLDVRGLMCIPPEDEPPALHFALLRQCGDALGFTEYSMGMSGDYEKAAALGARYVRVGRAIFGARV